TRARKILRDVIEKIAEAEAMFGGYGKDVGKAEAVEIVNEIFPRDAVDFVHNQRDWLAEPLQNLGEITIRGSDLAAAIDQEDDAGGAVQGEPGLLKDLRRNEILVVRDDAAGIDQLEFAAPVFRVAVNAVARDAGFVADDRTALAENRIEQSG